MNKNFTKVYVLDPATGQPVDAQEWLSSENKTAAEWVIIENTRYNLRVALHKNGIGNLTYNDALAAAAKVCDSGRTGSRIEWISVYNAIHTAQLNEVLTAIGGEVIKRYLYWTEEMDEDQSYSIYAWIFYGSNGFLNSYNLRVYAFGARVFRAF